MPVLHPKFLQCFDLGGMFARRAPGALLFYLLSRLQPQIHPLMEKPPK